MMIIYAQTFRVTVVITNHIHTIPEPLSYTSDSFLLWDTLSHMCIFTANNIIS